MDFFDCIASSLTPTKNITDEGSYWVLISCAIIAKIEGHLEESKSGFSIYCRNIQVVFRWRFENYLVEGGIV